MRPFSTGIAAVVAGSRFPVIGGRSEQRENRRLIERSSTFASQPIHQNVDESTRAGFPAHVGIVVADSDQRA
jgi:hypothetical protein